MSHISVLIVGAGPTGLMMACELARQGVSFRIIDKNTAPTQGSNATWIQTRTLEIFEAIGIADRFLQIGHQCDAINFYEKGQQLSSINLNTIDSNFPFILMLPQRDTERLLTEKLDEIKVKVERASELIDIKQTTTGVVSYVRKANGDLENIKSSWLIACDGANSTVREKCHLRFRGEDISEQFMVADAQMDSLLPTNEIHVFVDKGTIFPERATLFSAFPWGDKSYRLSANLYLSHPRQSFTEHEVKEIVAERTYGNYLVNSVSWISPFWIHGKIVKKLRENFILLAGDAAHVHSPAGGQGMNTGIQDAFNLAWKLALVIKKKMHPRLLDSYQAERYPVDKEIVKQTEFLTKMVLYNKSFFHKLKKFSQKISSRHSYTKNIANELSQLNIRYKTSPVIVYHPNLSKKSPRQGERAPNVLISETNSLYKYLNHPLHTVLIFSGKNTSAKTLIKINTLQKKLNKNFFKIAKVLIINETLNKKGNLISDPNGSIHHRYNIFKSGVYIVRPDNYIGYFSYQLNYNNIKKYFQKFIVKK